MSNREGACIYKLSSLFQWRYSRAGDGCREKTKKEDVSEEAKEKISERLSRLENLGFPRPLESTITLLPSERKAIFIDLLSRDAALFLERYGLQITRNKLNEFDSMKDDYENPIFTMNMLTSFRISVEGAWLGHVSGGLRRY